MIAASAVSGAPVHIVHINSSCIRFVRDCLTMIGGARARGLDVTTEAYPYGAGMTSIVDAGRMTTIDESALYAAAQAAGEAITIRSGLPDKAKFPTW